MNEQPIKTEIEMNELSVSNEELAAANEQLRTEIAEHKLADKRIEHLNSVLKAIRNVNQLITREKDRERLIQKTCDLLVETRGYRLALALLVDGDGSFASAGVSDEQGLSTLVEQMKQGQYPKCVHEVLTGEQSVAVYDDVRNQHQGCVLADCNHSIAAFVVRLEYDGKVYGAIVVGVPSEIAWDEEEQGLFRELAGDISYALVAIESEKERQRVEEVLRESRERFRALTENTGDWIWEVNVDGTYTYVSPRVKEILGYEPEEVIGKTPFDLMPAEEVKRVAADFRAIVES